MPRARPNVDAPLPRGTFQYRPQARGAHFDPRTNRVTLTKQSRRQRLHEKAHYLWIRRLTPDDRAAFTRRLQAWADREWKQAGERRRDISRTHPRHGDAYPVVEELWAISYAAHKQGQRLHTILRTALERALGTRGGSKLKKPRRRRGTHA